MREDGRSVEGGRREGDHQSLRPLLLVLLLRSLLCLLLFLHPLLLSFSLPPPYVYRLFLSPSVPTYYPLYLPSALSFSVVHPSTTLAGRPPSPFSVPLSFFRSSLARTLTRLLARSLTHIRSLARSFARPLCRPAPPICKLYPRSPRRLPCLPLSPSVCLASSFPSFIPSRRTPPFPSSFYPSSTSLSPRLLFFYPPFASAVPLTLSFSFSLAFSISPFLLPSLVSPFSVLLLFSARRPAPFIYSTPFAAISSSLFLSFRIHSPRLSRSFPVPLVPPLSLQELTLWASFHPSTTPFTTAVENSSKNIYSTACNTSMVDGFGKKRTTAELEGRTIIVALNLD